MNHEKPENLTAELEAGLKAHNQAKMSDGPLVKEDTVGGAIRERKKKERENNEVNFDEDESSFQKINKGSKRKIEDNSDGRENSKSLDERKERYKKIENLDGRIATMELEASENPNEQKKLADLKRDLLTLLSEESEDLLKEGKLIRRSELIEGINRLRNSFNSNPEKVIERGQKYFVNVNEVFEKFPDAFNPNLKNKSNVIDVKRGFERSLDEAGMIEKLKAENLELKEKGDVKQIERNLDRIAKLSLSIVEKNTGKRNGSEDQKAA